eukprot:CAMPEP_0204063790 /NCGR_PEP_ID=MMETSP0360-20130528/147073_1 /ASSEMBLY_ACC=CAM_ASM_000342 /TAXON_ID=268821 /ORGANISM="Scrippsiella Hangoei, Strain SHTV-5" /LENGTH=47 /DNA_ID= /DNA_START= /DNA_END= /DNA_ORIENTATION=
MPKDEVCGRGDVRAEAMVDLLPPGNAAPNAPASTKNSLLPVPKPIPA